MPPQMSDDAQQAFTASSVEPGDECEALDDLIRELESVGGQEHGVFAASNASPRSHHLLQPSPLLNRSPSCERLGEDVIGAVEEELHRKSSLGASGKGLTYREMRQRLRQMRYEMKLEEQRRSEQITCDCFSFIWRKSERVAPTSPATYDDGIGRHSADRDALGVGAQPSARYSAAPALNQLTDPEPERARQILSTPPALDSFMVKTTHSDKSVDLGAVKESMRDVLKDKYGQQSDVAGAALAVTPLRQILGPPKVRAVAADDSARTASLADDSVRRASRDAFLQRQRLSSGFTSPDSSRHSRGSSSSVSVVRMMAPRKLLAPVTPEEVMETRQRLAHVTARERNSIAFGGSPMARSVVRGSPVSPVSSPASSPDNSMRGQDADLSMRRGRGDALMRLPVSPDSSTRRGAPGASPDSSMRRGAPSPGALLFGDLPAQRMTF